MYITLLVFDVKIKLPHCHIHMNVGNKVTEKSNVTKLHEINKVKGKNYNFLPLCIFVCVCVCMYVYIYIYIYIYIHIHIYIYIYIYIFIGRAIHNTIEPVNRLD